MKTISLLILAFCLCVSAFADNAFKDGSGLLKACNEPRFAQACLAGLLTFRCNAYSASNLDRTGKCLDAARDAAALMDIRAPGRDGQAVYVAFPTELVYWMKEPFTLRLLKAMKVVLEKSLQTKTPFDLWTYTLRAMGGDERKATWFLGVVLQDSSSSKVHLAYLQDLKNRGVTDEAKEALSDVLDLLEPEQLTHMGAKWIRLYPPLWNNAESTFRPNIYHFYTIAYLGMRLNWMIKDDHLAAFIPFLLDASYKFRAISPERWPLADPLKFDAEKKKTELSDLYSAYLAGKWGVNGEEKPKGREEFVKELSGDPFGFMRKLYLKR